jgi:hypothetical protein
MTTLEGRPNTALLVIDAQNAVLAAAAGRDKPAEFTPLTRPVERGEMPLSGIRWRRER